MFEIGKQVVCIITEGGVWPDMAGEHAYNGPKPGQVLTIRSIRDYRPYGMDCLGLQFFEFNIMTPVGDAFFESTWFRPVKTTSIECFRQYLVPADRESLEAGRVTP